MMKFFFFVPILFFGFINDSSASELCDTLENGQNNISDTCLKQIRTVCNNNKLAWTFLDASSKFLFAGMTYTNAMDYGNFAECSSIDHEDENGRIVGKFCGSSVIVTHIFLTPQSGKILKNFEIDVNATSVQTIPVEILSQIVGQIRDTSPNDAIMTKHAMCVPDACTPKEVGTFFHYDLDIFVAVSYIDTMCETKISNTELKWGDITFISFLVLIVLMMIASTLYDALCQNFKTKPYHQLLLSFSILFNGKKLLQISNNTTEQVQCFNGMRFISMIWVMAYHATALYMGGMLSLQNYPEVEEWNETPINRYINSAILAVDTFFFISGFLLAFTYLKRATKETAIEQVKKVPKIYLHRYLRLTPSVAVMYFTVITIFRLMGSGPIWSTFINFTKQSCLDNWWKFFLYIQNYTDPGNMCINPTWYLSADMQMFILAPIVLIPTALFIKKKFLVVMTSLIGFSVFWVICPMIIKYWGDQERGNLYSTHDRFNNFLIGITFGAFMRMKKEKPFIFSPIMNIVLWIVVIVVPIAFNIYWFDVEYYYSLTKYTLFMGLYKPVWCLCLIFMVYSCYHNHGGIVQWFLTRPSFQILGRLSYSMYVLHAVVEMYAGLTLKTTFYFTNYLLFYTWCGHLIVTMVLSVFWVLAFEFPMMTIDKYLLDGQWLDNIIKKRQKPEAETQ